MSRECGGAARGGARPGWEALWPLKDLALLWVRMEPQQGWSRGGK